MDKQIKLIVDTANSTKSVEELDVPKFTYTITAQLPS